MKTNNPANKVKLGIFVTIGTVLFIGAIYFIGRQQNMFGSNIHISAIFQNVGGLQEGSAVRFTGINVGTVNKIELISDTSVRVEMIISKKTGKFIKQDAMAIISSDGLMGNKIISIEAGTTSKPEIADYGTLKTTKPVNTEDIMKNMKHITENADKISNDLALMFHKINNGEGPVGVLLSDNELAANIKGAVKNLNEGTLGLKAGLQSVTNGMGVVVSDVRGITTKIKNGDGALGMVISDTAFARSIKESVENVKKGTAGFSNAMDALHHSLLLRGAYRREERDKQDKESDIQDSLPTNKKKK